MPPDNDPVLIDAIQDASAGVSRAGDAGARSIGGAFTSGVSDISATFDDIELMTGAVRTHTSFVQSQVPSVVRISVDGDLLASMPLSPVTGASAVAAVLLAAGQLQAHVVISEGLAIVSATIVSTYQLADSALSMAAAGVGAAVGITGEIVVGAFNITVSGIRTSTSAAVLGVTAVVLAAGAIVSLTAGALAELGESLVQAIEQAIEVYAADPVLFLSGVVPFVVMTAAFTAANYSATDLMGNATNIFQGGLGLTGPFFDDIVEGLIYNGQTFGMFNDGTTTLGARDFDNGEIADRADEALAESRDLINGVELNVDSNGNVVPSDVASLLAGASQIDRMGDTDAAVIRIIENVDADGNKSFVVQIPSTMSWNPWSGTNPNDVTSDLYAMARGDQTALAQSVYQAMERAGIGDEPVMLAGFSLGGITAGAIAAGDSGYNITQVVTAGSPIGEMGIPSEVQVIALEARQDAVPALDGVSNPSSWVTVHEDAHRVGAEGPGTVFSPANAHNANRYAAMSLAHPEVNADAGVMEFLNGGGTSVVTDYFATRG